MKALILFLSILIPASALAQGGVGAGSGGRPRYSSVQGFILRHSDSLLVTELSPTKTRIDNSRTSPRRVSRIEFETMPHRYYRFDMLEREMKRRYPRREWETIHLGGASALAWLRRDEGRLRGLYYILTSGLTLIRAELDAYADGQGIELIEPIVLSLAYDEAGPMIEEVRIEGPLAAGRRGRFLFKAVDDLSGVDTDRPVATSLHLSSLPAGQYRGVQAAGIEIHGRPVPVEGRPDWYSIEFEVNRFQTPGTYYLGGFHLRDRAGNWGRSGYPAGPTEVTNPEGLGDSEAPVIHEARLPEMIHAGVKSRLLVRASDNLSGVAVGDRSVFHGTATLWFNDGFDGVTLVVEGAVRAAPEAGEDWYALEFELSRFVPGGHFWMTRYYLQDRAGNRREANLPVRGFRPPVVPTSDEDRVSPLISELKLSGPLRAGGSGRLYLRARESGSGLDPDRFHASIKARDFGGEAATLYLQKGLRREPTMGEGWYSIGFKVNEHAPAGIYLLSSIQVQDRAGHRMEYSAYDDGRYHDGVFFRRTPLRVLSTSIDR